MAARINTKFIIILAVAFVAVGTLIGGLWYLQIKGDAARNVAEGDKFYQAGEFERARAYYSRAVGKEPGRADYVKKLEDTVLQMRPTTSDRATELYRERVNILRHAVRHNPTEPAGHIRLIEELLLAARTVQQADYWEQVESAAKDMHSRVFEDSAKAQAKVYEAQSVFARTGVLTDPSQLERAEQDLITVVETHMPDDDLAWATLVDGQIKMAGLYGNDGQTRRADDMFKKAGGSLEDAKAAVSDGPELTRVEMSYMLAKRARGEDVTLDDLEAAADRVVATLDGSQPSYMFTDAAEVLRNVAGLDRGERIRGVLETYLAANPDAHQLRYYLARIQFLMRDLDGASENAVLIKDAEPLAVSFPSRLQDEMRKRAAALIVEVEQERWAQSRGENQEEAIARIRIARDELAAMVTDPETDLLVARADGKLAFAEGDYRTAATRLQTVIDAEGSVDPRLLIYAATALEQIDAFGLALERTAAAADLSPTSVPILVRRARLEAELGRFDEARLTLDRIKELDPDDERAAAIADIIARREIGTGGDSPVISALTSADAAFAQGEVEQARAMLATLLESHPNDRRVLEALARLEISQQNKDEARALLERAIAQEPENRRLAGMIAAVELDDPVDSVREYLAAFFEDPADRAIAATVNYSSLSSTFERRADTLEQRGENEDAARAREVASRARSMAAQALVEAKSLRPDSTQLVEFEVFTAIREENWPVAEDLLAKAGEANLDMADGAFYRGRYEIFRGRFDDAIVELENATTRIPWSNPAWRALTGAYLAVGDYRKALNAAERAYNCNPNQVDTLQQYAGLLVRLEQQSRALSILRNARNRFAGNLGIREAWLELEADVGDKELALAERRATYEELPSDRVNAIRLAEMLSQLEPTRLMVKSDKGEVRYTQREWERLGRRQQEDLLAEQKAEYHEEADAIMDLLIEEYPDDHQFVRVKAILLRVRGDVNEGEALLKSFIMNRPAEERTVEMFLSLAAYQADAKRFGDSIQTLQAGRDFQSDDQREADLALAKLFSQLAVFNEAIKHYKLVNEVAPSRDIKLQLIEMQTRARMYDEAEELLNEVIAEDQGRDARNSSRYMTAMLRAGIHEGRGEVLFLEGDLEGSEAKFAVQREALAEAQELNRSSATPQIMLARGLLRAARRTEDEGAANRYLDDALLALERAENVRGGTIEASMVRVDVYRQRDDRAGAIAELTRLLEQSPSHDRARRILLQLYIDAGEDDTAISVAEGGTEANPTMGYWFEMLGDLLALKKRDLEAAGEAYFSAYQLQANPQLVSKLADVWLAAEDPNYGKVVDLIQREEGQRDPLLAFLYAKALDATGQREQAIAQVKVAYNMHQQAIAAGADRAAAMDAWFRAVRVLFDDPSEAAAAEQFVMEGCEGDPDSHLLRGMALIWFQSGPDGWSRAFELQEQAIAAVPENDLALKSTVYLDLGQYQIVSGRYEEATETLSKLLEWDPDHLMALNNYAYLLAEHHGDPRRALPYAQRAALQGAANPDVLDTLGWIEYKLGPDHYESARQHLLESLRDKPAPATSLHLAQVLVALGEYAEAQRQLERALELAPDDQTKAEIEALSDDIRTRADRDG